MNSKYAHLITTRFNDAAREDVSTLTRYMVSTVIPLISRAAYQGLTFVNIPGLVNDDVVEALEKLDYVVRREGLFTSIEWSMQSITDEHGNPKRITPKEYNERKRLFRAKHYIPPITSDDAERLSPYDD